MTPEELLGRLAVQLNQDGTIPSSVAPGTGGAPDFGEVGDIAASAFADVADAGVLAEIARADHRHPREANPITAHEAALDPHAGYLTPAEGGLAYDALGAAAAAQAAAIAASQPLDADLTAIAALATTSFGRSLLELADAVALAAVHTHGGGSASDPPSGTYAPGSFTLATGRYALMAKRLTLTGAQRATVQGTARLRSV